MAQSWGLTRCQGGFSRARLVLGVIANSNGRPSHTLPIAEVTERIHTGKSAREYCCPRQVGRPLATTQNKSWLATRNGTNRQKNSALNASTGSTPRVRYSTGAPM